MKNALISPNEQPIKYISEWTTDTPPQPIYTPIANGQLVEVINNLNNTVTLVFAEPHYLTKFQTIAIINFDSNVNGYRIVQSIVDNYRVTIVLSLVPALTKLTGVGIVMIL